MDIDRSYLRLTVPSEGDIDEDVAELLLEEAQHIPSRPSPSTPVIVWDGRPMIPCWGGGWLLFASPVIRGPITVEVTT